MIPKNNMYESSTITARHSRADVEELLEKFGCSNNFAWKRDDPQNSYLAFQRDVDVEGIEQQPLTYKVSIPFIEKNTGTRYNKKIVYNENRSYRILFHTLKHMLLNTEVGMTFEQVFGNYIVVGQLGDGTPISVQDKIAGALIQGRNPALGFAENKQQS
jgi:hypothetical protein